MSRNTPRNSIALLASLVVATSLGGCGSTDTAPAPAARANSDGTSGLVPDTKPIPQVRWLESTVPKGTAIRLSLIDSLASGSTHKGDSFRTLVTEAILIGGTVTVPSGSNVMGEVREVIPSSTDFKGKGGMLLLDFNRIGTPTGAVADLKARLTALKSPRSSAFLAGPSDPGAVVAGTRGREVVLEPGTPLTIVLQAGMPIKVKQ